MPLWQWPSTPLVIRLFPLREVRLVSLPIAIIPRRASGISTLIVFRKNWTKAQLSLLLGFRVSMRMKTLPLWAAEVRIQRLWLWPLSWRRTGVIFLPMWMASIRLIQEKYLLRVNLTRYRMMKYLSLQVWAHKWCIPVRLNLQKNITFPSMSGRVLITRKGHWFVRRRKRWKILL